MSRLKLNGTNNIVKRDDYSFHSMLESGRKIDSFPKWWDKKGTVTYINCVRIHITRPGVDLDLLIPSSSDIELDFSFDPQHLFRFHHIKNIKRVGIFHHKSCDLLAEYIFPRQHGQKEMLKQYQGFFTNEPKTKLSFTYTLEAQTDFGGLSHPIYKYDCNLGNESFDLN